jgi:nicotinate-nucleotide pyrophosphorylase (carboxylating)
MHPLDHPSVLRLITAALEEDLGWGDVTTQATVPPGVEAEGTITAKEDLVIAGLPLVAKILSVLDPSFRIQLLVEEGTPVSKGQRVIDIEGRAAPLLMAERVVLNFLQHLSGVATLTRKFVDQMAGSRCKIVDTRKTLPGLRLLEKYAVTQGGGMNHRMGLDSGILIKDNHIAICGGVEEAVRRTRRQASALLRVEVECANLEQVKEALGAQADIILLDNMATAEMAAAVQMVAGKALLEASGGMTLGRMPEVAQTGVDFISVGALTHSARAVDLSMAVTCI